MHAVIDVVTDYAARLPSPQSEIFLGLIGGQASARPKSATACPHRDALWATNVHTRWEKPDADESDRIVEACGDNYLRLTMVKAKYDLDNLFRNNQNIQPRY